MTKVKGITNKQFTNWSKTYSCYPSLYFEPESIEELKEIVNQANQNKKKLKIAGKGHSPSSITCTNDYMVSLKNFNKIIDIDTNNLQVKAEAGMTIEKLNLILKDNNMAFSVLGSIGDLTIAGAISTAFHGTGSQFKILNSYVTEIEMLLASGEIKTYSRDTNSDDEFLAILCSLGCIGIILSVKLQCERSFKLEQIEYGAKLEDVLSSLDVYVDGSDHFRMFWFPHTDNVVCYNASRTDKDIKRNPISWFQSMFIGYYLLEFLYYIATFVTFLIPYINGFYYKLMSKRITTVDLSYNIFNFDCLFKQHVYELAIPRKETAYFILKLKSWLENNPNVKVHFPVEIRFVKGDDIWLSPSYQMDSCYINIIMYRPYGKEFTREKWWDYTDKLREECNGRPHWAKTHGLKRNDLTKLYPKFEDFEKIRKRLDPTNMFMNECLEQFFN